MPAIVMATAGLSMLARGASDKKMKTEEAKADEKHLSPASTDVTERHAEKDQATSADSYVSSQKPPSTIQRPDSKSSDRTPPPTYSHDAIDSPTSVSNVLPELVESTSTHSSSSLAERSGGTASHGHAVRVRTKGHELKSGFPYHAGLYDLRVRPDDWQRFSDQLIDSTKFDSSDYAKIWAAVGSLALTGSILTSMWVGRTMNRSIQEKKVETGLVDTSPGSLGETLEHWNTSYFAPIGLCAHLELSESAMRKPRHKSSVIRKPSLLYKEREERARKREDRKFVVVVAELYLTTRSSPEEIHELVGDTRRAEISVLDDPRCHTAELPGVPNLGLSELSSADDMAKEDVTDVICGISEAPGDMPVEPRAEVSKEDSLWPRPLALVGSKNAPG